MYDIKLGEFPIWSYGLYGVAMCTVFGSVISMSLISDI